jgi:hypothetical protein
MQMIGGQFIRYALVGLALNAALYAVYLLLAPLFRNSGAVILLLPLLAFIIQKFPTTADATESIVIRVS